MKVRTQITPTPKGRVVGIHGNTMDVRLHGGSVQRNIPIPHGAVLELGHKVLLQKIGDKWNVASILHDASDDRVTSLTAPTQIIGTIGFRGSVPVMSIEFKEGGEAEHFEITVTDMSTGGSQTVTSFQPRVEVQIDSPNTQQVDIRGVKGGVRSDTTTAFIDSHSEVSGVGTGELLLENLRYLWRKDLSIAWDGISSNIEIEFHIDGNVYKKTVNGANQYTWSLEQQRIDRAADGLLPYPIVDIVVRAYVGDKQMIVKGRAYNDPPGVAPEPEIEFDRGNMIVKVPDHPDPDIVPNYEIAVLTNSFNFGEVER